MKRTLLFFILFTSTLVMAGEDRRPFKDFVSRCRDHKPTERMNEYRAKMDTLSPKPIRSLNTKVYFEDLISEIAEQGDFEGLDLLEKDLSPDRQYAFWRAVEFYENLGAAKLLVKWAKENPAVIILMKYHPNGLNLLIDVAENKKAEGAARVKCLEILASMPAATKFLDRIKALMSDQSVFDQIRIGEVRWDSGIQTGIQTWYPKTVGEVAARTVETIESAKKLQEK
jgi:hypothetical protein